MDLDVDVSVTNLLLYLLSLHTQVSIDYLQVCRLSVIVLQYKKKPHTVDFYFGI